MPRLSRQLLAFAFQEHALLPLLLRSCHDLRSARLELKWLEKHARNVQHWKGDFAWKSRLLQFCISRSRGKPLQYILGTEYFGELELKCSSKVLIPRQETAAYVQYLSTMLQRNALQLPSNLRILDLCTGSGCIPLLLAYSLPIARSFKTSLEILGVDICSRAISLAKSNQRIQSRHFPDSIIKDVMFLHADILHDTRANNHPALLEQLSSQGRMGWDILISNPPYVSPQNYNHTTSRSVRNFEPRLALVPETSLPMLSDDAHGDLFYPRLLHLAEVLRSKVLLVEVADLEQANRVVDLARASGRWDGTQLWRDDLAAPARIDGEVTSTGISVRGRGSARSVLCWRGPGALWLRTAVNDPITPDRSQLQG